MVGRFCRFTKHFLTSSTSAQPPLALNRHCSGSLSSAHPDSQTPFKCCSGSSPSSHPLLNPDFGHPLLLATCPLPVSTARHEFDRLYATLYKLLLWDPGAQNSGTHKKQCIRSLMAHPIFIHGISCLSRCICLEYRSFQAEIRTSPSKSSRMGSAMRSSSFSSLGTLRTVADKKLNGYRFIPT